MYENVSKFIRECECPDDKEQNRHLHRPCRKSSTLDDVPNASSFFCMEIKLKLLSNLPSSHYWKNKISAGLWHASCNKHLARNTERAEPVWYDRLKHKSSNLAGAREDFESEPAAYGTYVENIPRNNIRSQLGASTYMHTINNHACICMDWFRWFLTHTTEKMIPSSCWQM